MGKALREFRGGSAEMTKAIREGVEAIDKEEVKKKVED